MLVAYILRQRSLRRPAQVKHELLDVGSHLKTFRNRKIYIVEYILADIHHHSDVIIATT